MNKIILIMLFVFGMFKLNCYSQNNEHPDDKINLFLNKGAKYFLGYDTIPQDYKMAFLNYNKAAELGSAKGQFIAAWMYEDGLGVNVDKTKAYELYLKSAKQGKVSAMFKAGEAYKLGEYVDQDHKKAVEWYKKGAENNDHVAQYCLAYMYYKGFGIKQSYTKALKLLEKSAAAGDIAGSHLLASFLQKGYGTPVDTTRAMELYRYSASKGYKQSVVRLNKIKKEKGKKRVKSAKISTKNHLDNLIKDFMPERFDTVVAESSNNSLVFSGQWEGKLFTFDWSGTFIKKSEKISIDFTEDTKTVSGTWNVESYKKLDFTSTLSNNTIQFCNLNIVMPNQLGGEDICKVEEGQLSLKQNVNGEISLVGNLNIYNPRVKEYCMPTYLVLVSSNKQNSDTLKQDEVEIGNDVVINNIIEKKATLKVFPNPTSQFINVSYTLDEDGDVLIEILGLSGQLIKQVHNKKMEKAGRYSLKELLSVKPGIYVVRLKHNNKVFTSKIVKQ